MASIQEKLILLEQHMEAYDNCVVAFSGGPGSTLLLMTAFRVRGPHTLAVTVSSPTFSPEEQAHARTFCKEVGIPHLVINRDAETNDEIAENVIPEDLLHYCTLCRTHMYREIREAINNGPILVGSRLADAQGAEDLSKGCPNAPGAEYFEVTAPLEECGFTEDDVCRALTMMNIDIHTIPQASCFTPPAKFLQHEEAYQ